MEGLKVFYLVVSTATVPVAMLVVTKNVPKVQIAIKDFFVMTELVNTCLSPSREKTNVSTMLVYRMEDQDRVVAITKAGRVARPGIR
jgi:hypothetical protein